MSEKRRDSKNRILRTGESQRKDGRYVYKYTDANGQVHFAYSWKLEKTDPMPSGKHNDLSLREKIKQIQKDLNDGIVVNGGNMTVLQLIEKYVNQKTGVRHNTEASYKTVLNIIKRESFGNRKISSVKISDAKAWFIQLQKNGRSYSSIHSICGVVRPAFRMAVDDDLIRKNPFDFSLVTVIVNDSVTREAITRTQERAFLKFIKEDNQFSKYYEGIYILFKTGMRISEFAGLTSRDIDMVNRTITIDHQLQRTGANKYIIEAPKSEAGKRIIPMTDDVYQCFKTIIENRPAPKVEPMVDGKVGFLYLTDQGQPMVAEQWAKCFKHIRKKYNSVNDEELPKITPHVCRHTYCSNMAKSGMNPKTLQYLMGHSDISVTLNTYTHMNYEDAKEEVQRVVNVE